MVIRPAQDEDVPGMNALMHASSAYSGDYRQMLDGYFVKIADLAQNKVFVAEQGTTLVGFYSLIADSQAELDLFFVSDEAQGSGVGSALFGHMKETARICGLTAVTIVSHPPSTGFYEHMGAIPVGISPPKGRATWERPILKANILET